MKERDPTKNPEHFEYRSARDHVLHDMALTDWANQSGGDTESHVGQFWRISNSEAELHEVVQAFEQSIESAGLGDTRELIGHFLVAETEDSRIVVMDHYQSEQELKRDFENLAVAYASWLEDQAGTESLDEDEYLRGDQE